MAPECGMVAASRRARRRAERAGHPRRCHDTTDTRSVSSTRSSGHGHRAGGGRRQHRSSHRQPRPIRHHERTDGDHHHQDRDPRALPVATARLPSCSVLEARAGQSAPTSVRYRVNPTRKTNSPTLSKSGATQEGNVSRPMRYLLVPIFAAGPTNIAVRNTVDGSLLWRTELPNSFADHKRTTRTMLDRSRSLRCAPTGCNTSPAMTTLRC